jgi:hypothetical protein
MKRTLIALLLLGSGSAWGQMDGNFILQDCGNIVKQQDGGAELDTLAMTKGLFCVGYVAGLNDAFRMAPTLSRSQPFYCPPERGISNDQVVRIVVKYLRDNPAQIHESARGSVLIALSRAFPCR